MSTTQYEDSSRPMLRKTRDLIAAGLADLAGGRQRAPHAQPVPRSSVEALRGLLLAAERLLPSGSPDDVVPACGGRWVAL